MQLVAILNSVGLDWNTGMTFDLKFYHIMSINSNLESISDWPCDKLMAVYRNYAKGAGKFGVWEKEGAGM